MLHLVVHSGRRPVLPEGKSSLVTRPSILRESRHSVMNSLCACSDFNRLSTKLSRDERKQPPPARPPARPPSPYRLENCEWMSRPGTIARVTPSNTPAAATAVAGAAGAESASKVPADSDPSSTTFTPCRFPRDGGRSALARRPACRLVLSIHDELLYEVGR